MRSLNHGCFKPRWSCCIEYAPQSLTVADFKSDFKSNFKNGYQDSRTIDKLRLFWEHEGTGIVPAILTKEGSQGYFSPCSKAQSCWPSGPADV